MSKMNEFKVGYVSTEVYKVEKFGNTFKLIDTQGVKVGTLGGYHRCKKISLQSRNGGSSLHQ